MAACGISTCKELEAGEEVRARVILGQCVGRPAGGEEYADQQQ